jgi:mRNA interferase HigB
VVENYLADHAGHKGIKAARSQYEAWLDIVTRANWRNPEDVKAAYPKASILKASRVVFNIKGNDYRLVARLQRPVSCAGRRSYSTAQESGSPPRGHASRGLIAALGRDVLMPQFRSGKVEPGARPEFSTPH